jgi:GR25 family glycosyltransferase involved in LPS biosynthesis
MIKSTLLPFFEMVKDNGYIIVGTCDVEYLPKPNEFVIYFGNYPDDYMALPQTRQIYRHFIFKDQIPLDRFESDECWQKIDRIFIMGLENEHERMNDTIMHLTFMNAPLNRIEEYRAKKDVELTDVYIGATKNHLDCLKRMIDGEYETCLFLEDDFVFSSNIQANKDRLSTFLNRNYDYNICFLSASKYHQRKDYDDLLIVSKQSCTTSSGYLINKSNIDIVYETIKIGYEKLLETNDTNLYCIDRYWSCLDKIYIFRNKIGFQKPSVSKITKKLNIELD